jgi:hypothetical protein
VNDGPKTDPIRLAEEAQQINHDVSRQVLEEKLEPGEQAEILTDDLLKQCDNREALVHALLEAHEEIERLNSVVQMLERDVQANAAHWNGWMKLASQHAGRGERLEGALREAREVLQAILRGEEDSPLVSWDVVTGIDAALSPGEVPEEKNMEEIAQFLWSLLDGIDTLDDACGGNDAAFREQVRKVQQRRFEVGSTDGYKVWWTPGENTGPPPATPVPLDSSTVFGEAPAQPMKDEEEK